MPGRFSPEFASRVPVALHVERAWADPGTRGVIAGQSGPWDEAGTSVGKNCRQSSATSPTFATLW